MITINPTLPPVPAIDASQTTSARKLEWPSELPPPEPQGQCERSRLATGSLPASSVQAILSRLEILAGKYSQSADAWDDGDKGGDLFAGQACAYSNAAKMIRAELTGATERQPEENIAGQPTRPQT